MAKRIADIYLADRMDKRNVREPMLPGPDAAQLAELLGEYRFGQSLWRIGTDKKGGLFAQVDGGEKKRLIPFAKHEFFDEEDGMEYRFVQKKDNVILETKVEKTKQTGKRLRLAEPPAAKLAEYVGTYRSSELATLGSLELRGPRLYLVMPKGEALLQFLENGECIARPRDAFFSLLAIQFTRNGDGPVTGYNLSTERVRNLRYAKVKIE
jgi:hypothetical protein